MESLDSACTHVGVGAVTGAADKGDEVVVEVRVEFVDDVSANVDVNGDDVMEERRGEDTKRCAYRR